MKQADDSHAAEACLSSCCQAALQQTSNHATLRHCQSTGRLCAKGLQELLRRQRTGSTPWTSPCSDRIQKDGLSAPAWLRAGSPLSASIGSEQSQGCMRPLESQTSIPLGSHHAEALRHKVLRASTTCVDDKFAGRMTHSLLDECIET